MLPPGIYSPSASFQTLLANISAAQRHQQQQISSMSSASTLSPTLQQHQIPNKPPPSPPNSSNNSPGGFKSSQLALDTYNSPNSSSPPLAIASSSLTPPSGLTATSLSNPNAPQGEDRRSSSIAALRLKAREHEMRLEMLRQNGHPSDVVG